MICIIFAQHTYRQTYVHTTNIFVESLDYCKMWEYFFQGKYFNLILRNVKENTEYRMISDSADFCAR